MISFKHAFHILLVALYGLILPFSPIDQASAAQNHPTLWSVDWNHDGTMFAVGGEQTLQVIDAETLKQTSLLGTPDDWNDHYFAATSVTWHPTNLDLLAVSTQGAGANHNGIFNVKTSSRTSFATSMGRGIAWNPSGDQLATSNPDDGHLRIWKSDGSLLSDIPRFKEAKGLTGVSWHPSSKSIVSIGAFITLHQTDGTVTQQMTHRPEAEKRLCLLLSVAWHPSGAFFVTGDYGNEIDDPVLQFWTEEGQLIKTIPFTGGDEIRNVAWSRDGERLATASDQLRIWDKNGTLLHEADAPDLLWGVDWHPKGDRILTSSIDGRITLWNSKAKLIKEIKRLTFN
jgi:WD40 repeat protein